MQVRQMPGIRHPHGIRYLAFGIGIGIGLALALALALAVAVVALCTFGIDSDERRRQMSSSLLCAPPCKKEKSTQKSSNELFCKTSSHNVDETSQRRSSGRRSHSVNVAILIQTGNTRNLMQRIFTVVEQYWYRRFVWHSSAPKLRLAVAGGGGSGGD